MKGNLFLKLEEKTNSKNKPKFLNVTFLDTFCIYSKKKWGKMVSVLQYILFHILLIQLMQKINKKFSFT